MDPPRLPGHTTKEIDVRHPADFQTLPTRLPYVERSDSDSAADDFRSLLKYWQIICRHKGTILILAILGAAVGFLLAMCLSPVYKARTSVEIQENRQNPLESLN